MFITDIITNKRTCIFVSPHLDDAMLSAGGLISYLSKKTKVIVVNVFTHSSDTSQTVSAWKFVKDMGYQKPSALFAQRREEDTEAFQTLGITPITLGFEDALWRKKSDSISGLLGKILPEFAHIYPTYRLHMTKGIVAKADEQTIGQVTTKLHAIINEEKNPYIFCPLGVGNHVDHRLVREVCERYFADNLIYWSDFPYNHRLQQDGIPPKGYIKKFFPLDMPKKRALINMYKTQVAGLFPGSNIPTHQEVFFVKKPLD